MELEIVDYIAIALVTYLFVGLVRLGDDFAQPPINQPPYVRSGNKLMIAIVVFLWPIVAARFLIVRSRYALGSSVIKLVFGLLAIGALFLWVRLAYGIGSKFFDSLIARTFFTIPATWLFSFLLGKLLGGRQRAQT